MGKQQEMIRSKDHVVIFPFMAKGHTIPLLHLTTALVRRGLRVSFVTTPANSAFVRNSLLLDHPNVHLLLLSFPISNLIPLGVESTDHLPSFDLFPAFLEATRLLRQPFHDALNTMSNSDLPLCVISDYFLAWTLDVCRQFGVPRLVFHGMGVFSMALCKSLWVHQIHLNKYEEDSFHVPGTPDSLRLAQADVPETMRNPVDSEVEFIMESCEAEIQSWGVVVNSFHEMESDYVPMLEAFYLNGARAWLVGPLGLYRNHRSDSDSEGSTQSHSCLEWLDGKPPGTVVYVSFGTQAQVPEAQLDEVAHGLEMSGCDFVWVVRSPPWSPPAGTCERSKGLIVRGWAPQRGILEHVSTGGFVSHCGWNSVLESLSAGVPILAWPMIAEQQLNAKYVVEELGAGLRVAAGGGGGVVGRREICDRVRELMGSGEKGNRVRRRAEELGKAARGAVVDGGSSYDCLGKLIQELRRVNSVDKE